MTEKKRGPYRKRRPEPCIVKGCAGVFYAKGLCRGHWARWRRTGDLNLKPQGRRWSEAEDNILLALPSYPSGRARHRVVEQVAALLGRSSNAATERRKRIKQGIIALV